jgi:shikimate dehydrogenase
MKAAVLGSPVAHSLSPVLHRAAYAHLHLDWTYEAVECRERDLPALVAGLGPQWAGLSLTMPLKTAVLPLLDEADEATELAGAANTLLLRDGRRVGANTDVPGMVAALAESGVRGPRGARGRALVIGAGATARSAVVSLALAGYRAVDVVARRPEAVAGLVRVAERVGTEIAVHPWDAVGPLLAEGLVVCTVPAGGADLLAGQVPARPGLLFDVVYSPWPTPLAAAWAASGGTVIGGLDLLVHQAAGQVLLMTGCAVGADELVAVMRPAGAAALASRGS